MSSVVKSKYAFSVTVTELCPKILDSVNISPPLSKNLLAKLFLIWCQVILFSSPDLIQYFFKFFSKLVTKKLLPLVVQNKLLLLKYLSL